MTFTETNKLHATWNPKDGICPCSWCVTMRNREPILRIDSKDGFTSPFDLDQEEAKANHEDWWNESSQAP